MSCTLNLEEKMRTGLRATIKGSKETEHSVWPNAGLGFSLNSPRKLKFSLGKQKIIFGELKHYK